ncbi:MAG: beta-N-acetylhexosaminidase [Chitinophagaceae bacterium]|nr:beta-N-acetylhexosaminidase [Chitinophagaceae bacterium]
MKKLICCLLYFTVLFCTAQNNFNIVPAPASIQFIDTSYTYDLPIQIVHTKSEAAVFNAVYLLEALKERNITGNLVAYDSFDMNRSKIMLIDEDEPTENYRIITPGKDIIVSGNNRTIFYGIQTLLQLIPSNQFYNTKNKLSIPYVSITDHPRFLYRGMHLDVCRHFFPVSFVKKYIDYLAAYKFNTFHWHLTDDQGWRIEIKKYPGLTTAGAWRNGTIIGRYPGKGSDNKPYGGFYTQEEIKEVVQYAAQRYIDVVPEIEMPGHGSAAIAAYPWLSCFPKKPTEIPAKMISQKSIDEQKNGRIKLVQETWGVFDDIFCAGRDSTFTFLENVIDEVIALFPSKYFHMGGDEAPKAHWKKCPACQKRMKDHKLKDEHELQSWFVQRIEKYVNSKGRILIGWDEILEGGLAPNAVVMSWRGEKGGIEAAKQKHQVIMTPGNPVYFDHTQSKNEDSVTIGGYNPIENVYAYEPVSKELSAEEGKYILGAQANMWTEYIKYPSKVEYHLFPRITALSEVLWSPKGKRNWKDFERRLPTIFERLDKQKINYSKAYYDLKATIIPTPDHNGILYKIETKTKNYKIQYLPSILSSSFLTYEKPLLIRETVNDMSVILSVDGKVVGGITQSFHFNKATGKKITIVTEADKKYPGDGAFTLVNGVQNEKGMSKTSEFLGFNGTDMEVTIDLGKETEVSKITLHSLNHPGSWIYLPSQVNISFIPFIDTTIITKHQPIESVTHIVKDENNDQTIQLPSPKTCRYVRVYAKNYGIIPDGKPGAGNRAWLFVDEIEVQ